MITTQLRQHRRVAAPAAALLVLLSISACDDSSSSSDGPPASSAPAATPSEAAATGGTAAGSDNAVTVTAHDSPTKMSYDITGTPNAGLVTIDFVNDGKYEHEMSLSLLKDGVTADQVKAALQKSEKAAEALLVNPHGEITGPAIAGPGDRESVVTPLKAGHYLVTCFLPGPDGMPHVAMGMIGELTVNDSGAAAAAPATDGTITLTDHSIELPDGFAAAGGGTMEVTNAGTAPHDVSFASLKGGSLPALFGCVGASFGKGTPIDKCPGTLVGGVTRLQPEQTAYLTLDLLSGDYGYVSTEGDGKDFQAGLNGTFTVK